MDDMSDECAEHGWEHPDCICTSTYVSHKCPVHGD